MAVLKQPFGSWNAAAPLILRLLGGLLFFLHGYQKVFHFGLGRVTSYFIKQGFPLPEVFAFVASYLELLGGVALLAGLKTRWVASALCLEMLAAILFVEMRSRFLPHVEVPLMLLGYSLLVVILGSGRWSLDARLERNE